MLRNIKNSLTNSSPVIWVRKKTTGLKFATKIILVILGVLFIWMLTGIFKSSHTTEEKIENVCVSVKAKHSHAQAKQLSITLNGYTKAYKKVEIKPEVDGNVVEVFVKNGQYLKKDDPIIRIEVDNKNYQLNKAKASLAKQQFNYEAAKKIFDKKLSSESALREASSNLKEAEAAYNQAKLALDKTIVRAPFNGYIDEILLQQGSFSNVMLGTTLAEFSSVDPLLVIAYIPQNYIDAVKDAKIVKILGANEKVMEGQVTFISKAANPNTRTFQIEAVIRNEGEIFQIGESVRIQIFFNDIKKLHEIPKSALVLNTDGSLCVKSLDETNVVKSIPIEILEEDDTSFWIDGLSEEAVIITLGQNFVKNGEKVNVSYQ